MSEAQADAQPRIRVDASEGVRTITLTRGHKRNAIDHVMLTALQAEFSRCGDATERVIVLRAEGPSFCAGMDLAERLRHPAPRGASPIEPLLESMEHHPLPIVAVVHGDAIAGGNELALHCDFVVAASTARFGMSLAQLGLAPTWGLSRKLLEVAGPVSAREILLLGDPLPAPQMHALGLIARVSEPAALEDTVDKLVGRLAANAPLSLRAIKATLVRGMQFRDGIAHDDIVDLVQAARDSEDAKEGIAARLAKRRPKFTGV